MWYAKHEILCPPIVLATINYALSNAEWPMIEAIVPHKQKRNEPVVPNRSFTIPYFTWFVVVAVDKSPRYISTEVGILVQSNLIALVKNQSVIVIIKTKRFRR